MEKKVIQLADEKQFLRLNDGGFIVLNEIAAVTKTENIFGTYNWFAILKSGKEVQISTADYNNLIFKYG